MSCKLNDVFDIYLLKGDIISFTYQGGSNPGSTRSIYVLSKNKKNISAWDFEKEAVRTFNKDKMNDVKFIDEENIKQLNLTSLPVDFDISTLIEQYENGGYKVCCHDDWLVAISLNYKKNQPLTCSIESHIINFGPYSLAPNKNETVSIWNGGRWIHNATIKDLKGLLERI